MKIFARLLLVVLLSTVFLVSGTTALLAEQNNIEVTRLSTEILPEYDTPDILVVHGIQIKNTSDKDFSGELRWIVPNGSKTHIVIDQNTSKDQLPFNLVQNNGNTEMVWKLSTPLKAGEIRPLHLEYYYNNIEGNVDKNFSFELIQPYPVIFGQLHIYQPTKATNFKLTPEMGPPQSGQFTSYQKSYSNLTPGQKVSVSVSYTKSDPNPSVTAPQNSSPGQTQAPNSGNNVSTQKGFDKKIGIYIIAGLAIIIVLLAVKIISNNRRLSEIDSYEMDYEESDDDFSDDGDDDEYDDGDDTENTISLTANTELAGERAKLERDFKAGRITEEDYVLMLEDLK